MPQEPLLFPAAPHVQQKWKRYVALVLVLALAVFLLSQVQGNEFESWMAGALAIFWVVLVLREMFQRGPDVRYELTDDALVIRNERGDTRYPYADLLAFSVQTFDAKSFVAYQGHRSHGHYFGTWRYGKSVYTLHATRRDRLVLFDTPHGVVGISPAPEVEDDFVAALQQKSGLAMTQSDEFAPQHAEKAVVLWPAYIFIGVILGEGPYWLKPLFPQQPTWSPFLLGALIALFLWLFRKPLWHCYVVAPWLAFLLTMVLFVWGAAR